MDLCHIHMEWHLILGSSYGTDKEERAGAVNEFSDNQMHVQVFFQNDQNWPTWNSHYAL